MPSQETNSYLNWSIPVAALLSAAVFGILGYYFGKTGVTAGPGVSSSVTSSIFKDTIAYLPHILLLFGVIADMLTYEGVYSIASFIGLISLPLNYLFSYFWAGVSEILSSLTSIATGTTTTTTLNPAINSRANRPAVVTGGGRPGEFSGNYNGCEVQGFSALRSPYAPQTLVITATIFFYYVLDLINNRGWVNSTATIILFFIFYVAQMLVIGNCNSDGDNIQSKWLKSLIAAFEGLFIGGISFAVVQSKYPSRLPSSAVSPFPRKSKDDLKPGTNSNNFVDESGNPYICLPGGQCYPDMSTQESRTAFAKIASDNLGTGTAPAADCSAR